MDKKTELLKTTVEHLDYLHAMAVEIVELLRSGEEAQGTSLIVRFVDEVSLSIEALETLEDVLVEAVDTNGINSILQSAIEGLENEDFILVADVFEYEAADILINWKKIAESSL